MRLLLLGCLHLLNLHLLLPNLLLPPRVLVGLPPRPLALVDQPLAEPQLEDLVQDHGFGSLEEWAATGDRIFQAWMAIEMAEQKPAARQEMEAALAEMENSPHMTAEQKAQMRAMMEGAMGAMQSASNAPAADIEAVRPHVEALRQLGEE